MEKKDLLKQVVKHIDIKSFDASPIINSMREMSFSSRETANAADIYNMMIAERNVPTSLPLQGQPQQQVACRCTLTW